MQPIKVETLKGDRLESADAQSIEVGDIVDVPVWMDVWYGGGGITVQPWTFMSFGRVIIVEKGKRVSTYTQHLFYSSSQVSDTTGKEREGRVRVNRGYTANHAA